MLVGDSSVLGKILNSNKFNLKSADGKDELVVDKNEEKEEEDRNVEETGNWVAMLRGIFSSDEEIGLITSISLLIALETLCHLELNTKL